MRHRFQGSELGDAFALSIGMEAIVSSSDVHV